MSQEQDIEPTEEPEEQRQQRKQLIASIKSHSGPIPPAEELARYDQVEQGLARDIVDMAIKEQNHTQWMEKVDKYAYWLLRIGANVAVIGIVILILFGSYDLFGEGYVAGGIAGIVSAIATILVSVLKGASKQKKDE